MQSYAITLFRLKVSHSILKSYVKPGEDPGRPLDQEQADETHHEVVGEAEQPGGDEVVGGAAGAGAGPGHVPRLEH